MRPGVRPLESAAERGGLICVPARGLGGEPLPLALLLHGAGGRAEHGIDLLRAHAEDAGILLVSVASRAPTWDVIAGGYGPDVAMIDAALTDVFATHAVDPRRVAVGGFSDGASYALCIGLANGDLFTHVIAFSPGFASPPALTGRPRLFVSHGTDDRVLPIASCSRRLVPRLLSAGYEVVYREFDGPHTVPDTIAREAVSWFLGRESG
jgi:predicted esterase